MTCTGLTRYKFFLFVNGYEVEKTLLQKRYLNSKFYVY